MIWRTRKEVVVLTNLLAFSLGVILLLLSKHYLASQPWKTASGLLGAYLTISIVVSLFHRSFLKPSEDEARKSELEVLLNERINEILGNSGKYGFSGFLPGMDYEGLFKKLEKGDTLWWLDTYCPGHELWENELRRALSRGANMRMLVLSAHSPYAVDRANEIGGTYTPERFKNELKSFIEALDIIKKETEQQPGKLEILEYTDRPGLPIYLVARNDTPIYAYSSLFLGKPTGVSFPHMKWTGAEWSVITLLKEYIEAKWERNRSSG